MNKKLFALLLVSAFALQLKAADGDDDAAPTSQVDAGAGTGAGADGGSATSSEEDVDDTSDEETTIPAATPAPQVADDSGSSNGPSSFEMPGKKDGKVVGLFKRIKTKVWTSKVTANLEDILKYGADNYGSMNPSEKAAYFNAQDAQWGLQTSRVIKLARAVGVVGFIKLARDVMKEQDDEDEDEVEA